MGIVKLQARMTTTLAQVSNVVGPAVLAAAVLSIRNVTYLDVATGLFGYFLSQNLEDITGVRSCLSAHFCSLE